ncbi:MAG: glycosyltransferase family 4 protein [Candidatus Limnocylindrales bacterium]
MTLRRAVVATYPPRHCGIAAFTRDLVRATGIQSVVALHSPSSPAIYPLEVHHRLRRDVLADYRTIAASLADDGVELVSIQHEYGIWGGSDGEYVLDFVRALSMPCVATLHTVRRTPTPDQHRILVELCAEVDGVVVMSHAAATLLTRVYGVSPMRVSVIPHGVPDLPRVDPDLVKPGLDLVGHSVILSFGLIGPGKGYERAIAAMPAVVAAVPDALYVILGVTHPELLLREGEAYRESLVARASELGVGDHVRFVNRFVTQAELGRWLQAADLFVTPYPGLEQIVSGTLSYAVGAGKAIVSTPYEYAVELLAEGRGILVPPASVSSLATAFMDLLGDPAGRERMGALAYRFGRHMVWSEVGGTYSALFDRVARSSRTSRVAGAGRPLAPAMLRPLLSGVLDA